MSAAAEPRFFSRELSWLEFNQRVLEEARDPAVPLLERVKFLAIAATNLDEFFMVRVGGLQILVEQNVTRPDPAGLTPARQLKAVDERVRRMVAEMYAAYRDELGPALAEAGIQRVRPAELSDRQMQYLEQYFNDEIYSVLTPMAVDSADPFPLLTNRLLHMAVRLKPGEGEEKNRIAFMQFSRNMSRLITLPTTGKYQFILLEDVVERFIDRFFPGEPVAEVIPFRITRNADISVREDLAADLLSEMEEVIVARKKSDCVRLEVDDRSTKTLLGFLQRMLRAGEDSTHLIAGPLDLSVFARLADMSGFDALRNEPWPPQPAPGLDPQTPIVETLARRDVLLHHPYDSFDPVVRLIQEAADDPHVLAIKQILYRTSRNSPVVAALQRAAEKGKNVTAIVELKARFDEERNIEWARALDLSGAQVIYGVKGLKTHAKVCMIVRREPRGIVRYLHFGTGNYNEITARLYSDISYLTANEDLGADASTFFNAITGYSQPQKLRKLEAAPIGLRQRLRELIEGEAERKRQRQKARIIAKVNSLVDPELIEALYAASQAGVKIDLNVRGICCLRPGVPGLSENIQVVSIVDRFLEHSRILYFHRGGEEAVFISSADWMPRNLDRRVELLVPVEDRDARRKLIALLETYFDDTVKARRLLPDGRYERMGAGGRRKALRSQEEIYRQACEALQQSRQTAPTVLEPHRAPASNP
jgi:polyphosphate kinase